jgi:ATP-dependent Clp protease ATP-binding subunit ClpA
VFERFTDGARRVVVLAQEEARLLNHHYIGTEHVLLSLMSDPDEVTSQALTSHGIDTVAVRQSVVQTIGEGTEAPPPHIPFTPRAKKVVELSLREALQMGHNYIGSEHILLGLIREGEGVAAQVLTHLGINLNAIRETVRELVKNNPQSGEPTPAEPASREGRFGPLFEHFNARALRVVVQAHEEARLLNHNYIGTEHVLLGLIAEPDTVSTNALVSHGLEAVEIRNAVARIVGEGTEAPSASTHIRFTPRAKRVLELSLRESLKLGHNYIDNENILLGLLREGEGIAAQVLTQLGVNLEGLRVTVMELIGIHPESGEPVPPYVWGAGVRQVICGHLAETLLIEDHDILTADSETVPVRLIMCTACGTTIGALPAPPSTS